jgi:hypothetical protein
MRHLDIVIHRGRCIPFAELPPYAIALDGYVAGPALDPLHHRYSFDHHAECLRLVTRATCGQVHDALLLGFDPQGHTLYLNDIDGDTVLATWLLLHPTQVQQPHVRALVEDVEKTDAHGPAWVPFQRNPELCRQFYQGVMALERLARQNKTYGQLDLNDLLSECLTRLDQLLLQHHTFSLPEVVTRNYTLTHQGNGWVMAHSPAFIFDLLYRDGHHRAIAWQEAAHDSWAYTIAKTSDLVQGFDIPKLLAALNQLEPGWGGGSSIGGAPRNPDGSRSYLPPDQVFAYIETILQKT